MALVASALLLLGADQLCKGFALRRLSPGQSVLLLSFPPVHLRHERNPAAPFVFLRTTTACVSLWATILASAAIVVAGTPFFQDVVAQYALGAALGGGTSNVLDRVRNGAVIDFMDLGFRVAFNLADVAIVTALPVALWLGTRGVGVCCPF